MKCTVDIIPVNACICLGKHYSNSLQIQSHMS